MNPLTGDKPQRPGLLVARHLLAAAIVVASGISHRTEAAEIEFDRDIHPILSDKCFRCHGPDEGERVSDLRLDLRESSLQRLDSGAVAIAPGDPSASEVVRRLNSTDADIQMPPPASAEPLTADERAKLIRWIASGAAWHDHWSFVRPRRPSPPWHASEWPRNPIDEFIVARLDLEGLSPAREAHRETLLRRAALALTGLPPSPQQQAEYLADKGPDAYERLVDRLLASPGYGEHQARYWLDLARYGDTHGLHLDNERSMWPYRDWVIRAFNRNQPYDKFTYEQLAGDLIPEATLEQRIATGFNRCNVTTSEGGAIDEEFLVRYAVDRVETTAATWLGLTVGCAACHDHKFDPISQREFYQLFAYFFNQTEQAMDGNALVPPPSVKAPSLAQQAEYVRVQSEQVQAEQRWSAWCKQSEPQLLAWEEQLRQQAGSTPSPSDDVLRFRLDEMQGTDVSACLEPTKEQAKLYGRPAWGPGKRGGGLEFDGNTYVETSLAARSSVDWDRDDAFSYGAWLYLETDDSAAVLSKMTKAPFLRGFDLYVADRRIYVNLVHEWDTNALSVQTIQPIRKEKWQQVMVTYDGSSRAAGVTIYIDGQAQDVQATHDALSQTIRNDLPLRIGKRQEGAAFRGQLDDVRLFARCLTADDVQALVAADPLHELVTLTADHRSEAQQRELITAYARAHDAAAVELLELRERLQRKLRQLENSFPHTLVMQERRESRAAHLLIRGQYDQLGPRVEPAVPAALPSLASGAPADRRALAEWLVRPDHPLTARVAVNRLWQQLFGTGIVRSSEDFGSQGDWPSHPELLDWLAVEFMESGWDVKQLQRLIVTSATFRQAADVSPEILARDPQNRWLARGPRIRLDAEVIRDSALAASGLLVGEIGGKSVKPYQPDGLWEAVGYTTSNTAHFVQDHGAALYRRSLYTFWKRTSPPPTMQILDAPSREVCTVRRPRTNSPAAALALLNDVQFVEAARQLAVRILSESPTSDNDERLATAYRLVLARRPDRFERELLQRMLHDFRRKYQEQPELAMRFVSVGESSPDKRFAVDELAAWTMIASTLLNLDETMHQP